MQGELSATFCNILLTCSTPSRITPLDPRSSVRRAPVFRNWRSAVRISPMGPIHLKTKELTMSPRSEIYESSHFSAFAKTVSASFQDLVKDPNVFVVDLEGSELYAQYLAAFPRGT